MGRRDAPLESLGSTRYCNRVFSVSRGWSSAFVTDSATTLPNKISVIAGRLLLLLTLLLTAIYDCVPARSREAINATTFWKVGTPGGAKTDCRWMYRYRYRRAVSRAAKLHPKSSSAWCEPHASINMEAFQSEPLHDMMGTARHERNSAWRQSRLPSLLLKLHFFAERL